MKTITKILCITAIFVLFTACDAGLKVTGVEIITYPDRLCYIAGIDTSLDLTGGSVYIHTKDKNTDRDPVSMDNGRGVSITHNIDFATPGIYIVTVTCWKFSAEFPVQVMDKDEINEMLEGG